MPKTTNTPRALSGDELYSALMEVAKDIPTTPSPSELRPEEEEQESMFDPPLYIQRYFKVDCFIKEYNDLNSDKIKVVCDLGCAELKYAKRFRNSVLAEKVISVDLDDIGLYQTVHYLKPQLFDSIVKRTKPLTHEIYVGNVCEYDKVLSNVDCVSAIELIEHMEPEDHAAFITNVFKNIQPKLVVITTPNVEFNVLFHNGSVTKLRHWDHRFEWTRQEFQQWCSDICKDHPYSVKFDGVGQDSKGRTENGFCSQIAVFTRDPSAEKTEPSANLNASSLYKLVDKIEYPWAPIKSLYERLEDGVLSVMQNVANEKLRDGECLETATRQTVAVTIPDILKDIYYVRELDAYLAEENNGMKREDLVLKCLESVDKKDVGIKPWCLREDKRTIDFTFWVESGLGDTWDSIWDDNDTPVEGQELEIGGSSLAKKIGADADEIDSWNE